MRKSYAGHLNPQGASRSPQCEAAAHLHLHCHRQHRERQFHTLFKKLDNVVLL